MVQITYLGLFFVQGAVERHGTQYRGNSQHDAQEFLFWLLDKVHEDLNTATKKKYKTIKVNSAEILTYLQGLFILLTTMLPLVSIFNKMFILFIVYRSKLLYILMLLKCFISEYLW